MRKFEFSETRIDHHVEKIGLDVRPILDVKMEREKLWDFGNYLVDRHPSLYESLVTGPNVFQIKKKLIFPGKGEAEVLTLVLSNRGPVFYFPRYISQVESETQLPAANDVLRACLDKFHEVFPGRVIVRAGKVNEYVFACDDMSSKEIVANSFLRVDAASCQEVSMSVNLATDKYNRSIEIKSVEGVHRRQKTPTTTEQRQVFGIAVNVDFNNKDMSKQLDISEVLSVLNEADAYNKTDLYKFLNGEA